MEIDADGPERPKNGIRGNREFQQTAEQQRREGEVLAEEAGALDDTGAGYPVAV